MVSLKRDGSNLLVTYSKRQIIFSRLSYLSREVDGLLLRGKVSDSRGLRVSFFACFSLREKKPPLDALLNYHYYPPNSMDPFLQLSAWK